MAQLGATLRRFSVGWLSRRAERRRRRRWFAALERLPIRDAAADELLGWVPIRVDLAAREVGWLPGSSLRFRRGHFYQTVTASLSAASPPSGMRTPLASLARLGESGADRPSGFVFHVSRCGSTLLGNMLLASERHLVVQEAESFNAILRDRGAVDSERIALLRGVAAAFASARSAPQEHLFVKFSSWNVLELPLLRRAFPDVPWVFVYRDPVEVVTSNLLQPGTWVSEQRDPDRGPYLSGADLARTRAMAPAEYCARVIDRYCRSALAHAGEHAHFVNYDQLSEPCLRAVLRAFGVAASDAELAAMAAQMSFYSKDPHRNRAHREDRARKQGLADDGLRERIQAWTREGYHELERRRIAL